MRIINRYVTTSFLTTLIATLVVLTFVMSIGILFGAVELLARGATWKPVARIFLHSLPYALAFAIPASALVSSLLVFGRLSADGEITAMKSCGISLQNIVSRPIGIACVLVLICLYVNNELAPYGRTVRREATNELRVGDPLQFMEVGRFINFGEITMYLSEKSGNRLKGVRIYDRSDEDFKRLIVAKNGNVTVSPDETEIYIDLYDVRITPFQKGSIGDGFMGYMRFIVNNSLKEKEYRKNQKDMTLAELKYAILYMEALYPEVEDEDRDILKMRFAVERNKRISLSLSALAFVLIGVPLGIRSHRRESSVGIAISLVLAFCFHLFLVVGESLAAQPVTRPDLIIILPVLLFSSIGLALIRRAE